MRKPVIQNLPSEAEDNMKTMRPFLTLCLLTGCIALVSVTAMAKNNPKPVTGTIDQGQTGPGNSPTPRPTTTGGVSLR